MLLPVVQKTLNIKNSEALEGFAARIYCAKFSYEETEYEGIIYTLVGNYSKGEVLVLECLNGDYK